MEITNKRKASRAKFFLITLPFILLVGSSLPALFLWIHTWIPTFVSGILVIAGWSATMILNLTSVRIQFDDTQISVFYHPISPMTSSYKRIDIGKGNLMRYEIRTSVYGLRKELILYENMSGQEASYPPISITLCSKDMVRTAEDSIPAYCPNGASS